MDTYYKECFVESVYHYEALENWQKFQIGDIFQLAYDDTHDIVKVENENFCIGKLSDEDSKSMLPFLKVGWDNLFYASNYFDTMYEKALLLIKKGKLMYVI